MYCLQQESQSCDEKHSGQPRTMTANCRSDLEKPQDLFLLSSIKLMNKNLLLSD